MLKWDKKDLTMLDPHTHFSRCLKAGRYFEAHEALELVWFPIRRRKTAQSRALQGLINASVSFELILRGRPEAALRTWETFEKYRPYIRELIEGGASEYHISLNAVEAVYKKFEDIYG